MTFVKNLLKPQKNIPLLRSVHVRNSSLITEPPVHSRLARSRLQVRSGLVDRPGAWSISTSDKSWCHLYDISLCESIVVNDEISEGKAVTDRQSTSSCFLILSSCSCALLLIRIDSIALLSLQTRSTVFWFKMPPKSYYTDPKLRDKVKEEIKQSDKGGEPGQWSARKVIFLY